MPFGNNDDRDISIPNLITNHPCLHGLDFKTQIINDVSYKQILSLLMTN